MFLRLEPHPTKLDSEVVRTFKSLLQSVFDQRLTNSQTEIPVVHRSALNATVVACIRPVCYQSEHTSIPSRPAQSSPLHVLRLICMQPTQISSLHYTPPTHTHHPGERIQMSSTTSSATSNKTYGPRIITDVAPRGGQGSPSNVR